MLMRRSKEGYSCETPPVGTKLASVEDKVSIVGVRGASVIQMGDQIAFTVFGALLKQPEYRGERERVLEKAQVYAKAITDKKPPPVTVHGEE